MVSSASEWTEKSGTDTTSALTGTALGPDVRTVGRLQLMLTVGVLLFGVPPNADTPVAPPTRHGAHPVPAKVELGPHQQRCTPRPAGASLCGREHPSYGHEPRHGPQKRLTPKELSLAKW